MARKTDSSDEKLDPSLIHKKKARRRLVGALAFLGSTAIALPFLLDAEPKPGTTQEVQIHVPAREPMTSGAAEPVAPQASSGIVTPPPVIAPPDSTTSKPESQKADVFPRLDTPANDDGKKPEVKKPEGKADGKSDAKSEGKAEAKTDAKTDAEKKEAALRDAAKKDAAKADAAKKDAARKDADKKDSAKKDATKKDESKVAKADDKKHDEHKAYSVQIGAFSSEDSAREQLAKAGKLGLKTYSEKFSTQSGSRYRARVGPFASREQAEQALAKLKLNGIDAAVVAP